MDIQALLFVLVAVLLLSGLFLMVLHLGFRAPRIREQETPGEFGLRYDTVRIPTVRNRYLHAWWLPGRQAREVLVILHGWGSNALQMLPLALPFHRAGLNVLLVDARNHGNSDADSFSSLPRFAEDVGSALDWLRARHAGTELKIALLGHSVGAGAVLLEASRRRDIAAVISISAFAHPRWMMQRYLSRWPVPALLSAFVMRYVEYVIGHRFADIAPLRTVCAIDCPVLLVHGTADDTVPVSDAHAIARGCRNRCIELLEIADAGHDSVEKVESHGDALVTFLRDACAMGTRHRA